MRGVKCGIMYVWPHGIGRQAAENEMNLFQSIFQQPYRVTEPSRSEPMQVGREGGRTGPTVQLQVVVRGVPFGSQRGDEKMGSHAAPEG